MQLLQYNFTFTAKYFLSNIIYLSCLVIFAVICLGFCWYYWRVVSSFRKFPSHRMEVEWIFKSILGKWPKDIPFTSAIFQDFIRNCKRFEKEGFCVIWIFVPYLFVFNEEYAKRFYYEPSLADKPIIHKLLTGPCLGDGLMTSNSDVWKKHRKLINPVFNLGMLKGKMGIFNENAADLVRKLEEIIDKPTTDLLDLVKRCSFNIMAESILGLKLNDEIYESKIEKYAEALEEATFSVVYRLPRPWLYWYPMLRLFPLGRKFMKSGYYIRSFTQEILLKIKNSSISSNTIAKDPDINAENKKSFARTLLEQHLKDPTFTMKDVEDEVTTMMAGGYDTAAHALMWCLYLLGSHPEVQKRAAREIEAIKERDVSYEDLFSLKYLDCVVKETLRMYPTSPIYIRKLINDVKCGNHTIRKGTDLAFFLYMLHRNPNIYPDPDVFDPERFSESSNIRPWMFMAFADGYRSCIGKKFAMMELKVLLVHILRQFEIKTVDNLEDAGVDWHVTIKTAKPVRMLLKLRQPQSLIHSG